MNNSVYDLSFNDWEEYLVNIGSKKFHAKQIFRWLYDKRVSSFDEMSDLKEIKPLLEEIVKRYI